jgi:hypothetical protein
MKKQVIFFVLTSIYLTAYGQNTISPYSIFGPGEIQNRGFGTSQAMGGAGISLKSGTSLNNLNPASLIGIDSLHFISEIGAEGKFSGLKASNKSTNGFTGGLKYLALGFRYTSWLAGSFGITPFSNVGYSVVKENTVEGTSSTYYSTYVGSGGISQFYFSNALKVTKRLSVGVNTSFMFGSLTQVENIAETNIVPQLEITRQDYLRSLYFDYGLRYSFKAGKLDYSLGLIYSNKQRLKSIHTLQVADANFSVIQGEQYNSKSLVVPEMFGIGFGIQKNERLTIALDYHFQNWSNVEYPMHHGQFEDSHRISFGIEFSPWEHRVINAFYKNWDYRFGFNYETSYLKFGNSLIDSKGLSFGVGVPLPGHISKMNLGFKTGINGTTANNLIRERYALVQLGFSLNEIWFVRRKFD